MSVTLLRFCVPFSCIHHSHCMSWLLFCSPVHQVCDGGDVCVCVGGWAFGCGGSAEHSSPPLLTVSGSHYFSHHKRPARIYLKQILYKKLHPPPTTALPHPLATACSGSDASAAAVLKKLAGVLCIAQSVNNCPNKDNKKRLRMRSLLHQPPIRFHPPPRQFYQF